MDSKHQRVAGQNACHICGQVNPAGSAFCETCGTRLAALTPPTGLDAQADIEEKSAPKQTSWAWWLFPIFLCWLGGLFGYLSVKESDRSMANKLLIFGIVWSVFWFVISLIWFFAFNFGDYPI